MEGFKQQCIKMMLTKWSLLHRSDSVVFWLVKISMISVIAPPNPLYSTIQPINNVLHDFIPFWFK